MIEQAIEYFESDLLPGVKSFACLPLRATLSVASCAARWTLGQGQSEGRYLSCKKCPIGAAHAGKVDQNMSPYKGVLMCARCHRTGGRLIGKHTCISCYNRAREQVVGANRKGTKPKKLEPLHRRSITYMTAGQVKTKTVDLTTSTVELFVAVLRDEEHSLRFSSGIRVPAAMRALLDDDRFNRSISTDASEEYKPGEYVPVTDVVDSAQIPGAVPIVPVVEETAPVPASLEVVQVDPYGALRDAVKQLEHDTPVSAPTTSKRAAKKLRKPERRQVRVSM